jgi:hypothetical protein
MIGLIYKDLIVNRKLLLGSIITIIITSMFFVFFKLSISIGNLKNIDNSFIYLIISYLGVFFTSINVTFILDSLVADKKSHFDFYSASAPLSKKQIVSSKYIYGFILQLIGLAGSIVYFAILSTCNVITLNRYIITICLLSCGLLWIISLLLIPLFYKLGNKNIVDIITILLALLFTGVFMFFHYNSDEQIMLNNISHTFSKLTDNSILVCVIVYIAAIAATAFSLHISVKLLERSDIG